MNRKHFDVPQVCRGLTDSSLRPGKAPLAQTLHKLHCLKIISPLCSHGSIAIDLICYLLFTLMNLSIKSINIYISLTPLRNSLLFFPPPWVSLKIRPPLTVFSLNFITGNNCKAVICLFHIFTTT